MSDSIQETILKDPSFTDSRLVSLYSNFNHLRETNPDGYEANIQAWSRLLQDLINKGYFDDKCAADSNSVIDKLSIGSKNLKPKGLNKVFEKLVSDGLIIPYSRFATTSINDILSKSIIKSIFSWSPIFSNAYKAGSDDENGILNKNEKFLSISKLKSISETVQKYIEDENPPIISETHLRKLLSTSGEGAADLSEFDISCCLLYLRRDTKTIRITPKNNIQFVEGSSDNQILSDEQIDSIANLKDGCSRLEDYNNKLTSRIEGINTEIRSVLKERQGGDQKLSVVQATKTKSLISLKKRLQESLRNNHQSLENMSLVLLKITDAKNNLMTVQTLESNSQLLKALNGRVGEVDDIAELMNGIHLEIGKIDAVSHKLGGSASRDSDAEGQKQGAEEESEIERELARLLAEETMAADVASTAAEDTDQDQELEARLARLKLDIPMAPAAVTKDDAKEGKKILVPSI